MSGLPFVLCGASGVGKTTLANLLLDSDENLSKSISYTTRAPRPGEENHAAYEFIGRPAFEAMIGKGDFVEFAEVYGDLYGTSHQLIKTALSKTDILLVLDLQGAKNLKERVPETTILFLVPPRMSDLEDRLRRRNTDSDVIIKKRLAAATTEISAGLKIADFVIVNDNQSKALFSLVSIIKTCRLQRLDRTALAKSLGI